MPDVTDNLASNLLASANAVAALGATVGDIAVLDENAVLGGMHAIREHRRSLQAYELAFAAAIARRSHHLLG